MNIIKNKEKILNVVIGSNIEQDVKGIMKAINHLY